IAAISSREDLLRPQSILSRPQQYEEPLYVKPAIRSARTAPTSTSPRLRNKKIRDGKYYRTNSAVEYTKYEREEELHPPSRSDSLDSGSLRIQRYIRVPRWRPPLRSYPYYDKIRGEADRQRFGMACGRGEPLKTWPPPVTERAPHPPSQILNARALNVQKHDDSSPELPSKYFSTEFRELYPIARRLSRRQTKSPVYRYGSSVPPALYDYDVWACRQDRRSLMTHAAILALVLFSVAFVISAGVILVFTVT
ncbi:hypothetical protein GCK32_009982, partial [Trichostrongylus colubriformis]